MLESHGIPSHVWSDSSRQASKHIFRNFLASLSRDTQLFQFLLKCVGVRQFANDFNGLKPRRCVLIGHQAEPSGLPHLGIRLLQCGNALFDNILRRFNQRRHTCGGVNDKDKID